MQNEANARKLRNNYDMTERTHVLRRPSWIFENRDIRKNLRLRNDCLYTLNLPDPPAMYQRWTEGSFFIWILEISTLVRVGGWWGTQGCPTWVLMCRCSGGDWRCHLALLPRRETVTSRPKGNTGMSWLQPDAKKHKCWGLGTSWLGSAFQGNLVLSPPELRFK